MAFIGVYGLHTDKVQQTVKVKKMDEYGTILLNIKGTAPNAVAELLDANGNVLRQQPVTEEGTADFYFPKVWEMKANFEFEENWDVNAIPIDKQKLDEIKKQKPEETKKVQDRNKERARKLGR